MPGRSSLPVTETSRTVRPAVIRSPSLRSVMVTFWPLTLVPLVLSMSIRRHCGGFTSTMKWMREMALSLTGSAKVGAPSDRR